MMSNYELFSNWLDSVLKRELPSGVVAFNFNLYEGSEDTYDIQLIGSDEFDENDEDWRCTDYFTTEEDICYVKRTKDIEYWEDGLKYITGIIERYLAEGEYAHVLKNAAAVGIGFVDGDVSLVYVKK